MEEEKMTMQEAIEKRRREQSIALWEYLSEGKRERERDNKAIDEMAKKIGEKKRKQNEREQREKMEEEIKATREKYGFTAAAGEKTEVRSKRETKREALRDILHTMLENSEE